MAHIHSFKALVRGWTYSCQVHYDKDNNFPLPRVDISSDFRMGCWSISGEGAPSSFHAYRLRGYAVRPCIVRFDSYIKVCTHTKFNTGVAILDSNHMVRA